MFRPSPQWCSSVLPSPIVPGGGLPCSGPVPGGLPVLPDDDPVFLGDLPVSGGVPVFSISRYPLEVVYHVPAQSLVVVRCSITPVVGRAPRTPRLCAPVAGRPSAVRLLATSSPRRRKQPYRAPASPSRPARRLDPSSDGGAAAAAGSRRRSWSPASADCVPVDSPRRSPCR